MTKSSRPAARKGSHRGNGKGRRPQQSRPAEPIVTLRIDALGARGDGIGHFEGRPVFVPRALGGEEVEIRLGPDRGEGHTGRLLSVLEPAPERVDAPCVHYADCGGCSLQHYADASYRAWTMARIDGMLAKNNLRPQEMAEPVFVPAGTRRRATMAALLTGGRLRLGFHRERSHSVTDIPECLILTPRLAALAAGLRAHLVPLMVDGRPLDVFMQDTGAALDVVFTGAIGRGRDLGLAEREALADLALACGITRLSWRMRERDEPEILLAAGSVIKNAGLLPVALPPAAFMQPSAAGEAALIAAACAPLAGRADLMIADLFAGCGTFTGPLLAHGSVLAAEGGGPAVDALAAAARFAGADGLRVEKRNLFTDPLPAKTLDKMDAVLFDPPRAGAKEQAAQIAASLCPLVIAVSCNPATFMRDAALLCAGGYEFKRLHIVDQFTWSAHTELVGIFTK